MNIREYSRCVSDKKGQIIGGIHPYHEVLYVMEGEFDLHWIGSVLRAKSPALFIFPASSPHRIEQLSPWLECWFVELRSQDQDYIPGIENLQAWNALQTQNPLLWAENYDINATVNAIQRNVLEDQPRMHGETFLHIMNCDIQKLLLQVNCFTQTRRFPNERVPAPTLIDKWSIQSYIYTQIRYLEDNYMHDITLDDLARRSGYTQSYIIRLFKEMTNHTPLQYLFELRMNAATSYLSSTPMSVQQIAETVGFPNIHYFSRMFKKKFGESPTEWKRTHAQ